jgi:uncharacterized phiE125 gp8 family phage protein
MGLTLLTPPAADAISLADVKAHLRITSSAEDGIIVKYIRAATTYLEGRLNRSFLEQEWELSGECFPRGDTIELQRGPLRSVTSIKYLDGNGTLQTFAAANYVAVTKAVVGRVVLREGKAWPTALDQDEAVLVTYKAGFGVGPAAIPMPISLALLGIVADLYEHRDEAILFGATGTPAGMPSWVDMFADSYRVLTP